MHPVRGLATSVSSRASAPLMTSCLDLIVSELGRCYNFCPTRSRTNALDGSSSASRLMPPSARGQIECGPYGQSTYECPRVGTHSSPVTGTLQPVPAAHCI